MEFMKEDNLKLIVKIEDKYIKNLYIMVGVPASGKSTYAKKLSEREGAIYVSRDEIRFSKIKDKDEYFSKEGEVFGEFVNRVQSALNDGKDVIADATHISRGSRAKLMRALDLCGVHTIAVCMNVDGETCMDRNSKREGMSKVPNDVMLSMIRFYSKPSLSEGFEAIMEVVSK